MTLTLELMGAELIEMFVASNTIVRISPERDRSKRFIVTAGNGGVNADYGLA